MRAIPYVVLALLIVGCRPNPTEQPRYGGSRESAISVPLIALVVVPEKHSNKWITTVGYLDSDPRTPSLALGAPDRAHPADTIRVSFSTNGEGSRWRKFAGTKVRIVGYFEFSSSTDEPYSRGVLTMAIVDEAPVKTDIPGGE